MSWFSALVIVTVLMIMQIDTVLTNWHWIGAVPIWATCLVGYYREKARRDDSKKVDDESRTNSICP